MPFRKVGRNQYRSPSGRKFTEKQVRFYYASGGTFKHSKGRRKKR